MSGRTFLALEDALVNRLKGELPDAVHVLTAADLATVAEGSQPTPAVHVVYGGLEVLETNTGFTSYQERWLAVIAVRNVAAIKSGTAARVDVGALAEQVNDALCYFRAAGARPLQPVTPPKPAYNAGYMYFPLAYTTGFTRPHAC
ncbi:MAG: DUF1834 domain-containing protein [Halothiobacillus sp.]|nr:DUF1834 domain-containing protein [Halothiobacillus sp.]